MTKQVMIDKFQEIKSIVDNLPEFDDWEIENDVGRIKQICEDVLIDWKREQSGILLEDNLLTRRLLKFLDRKQALDVTEIINTTCSHCWDNDTFCNCMRDE